MLQQTRVETVIPYYQRFMARFPTPSALADAADAEVLRLWSGLGYYRRALFLKAAAARVVEEHGGRFPSGFEAILALPGVGRYTAGAVASIAFGVPVPVVDGNVIRVLTRLGCIPGDPKQRKVETQIWSMAEALVDRDAPGESNQALMELGATVCSKTAPLCVSCPVARWCEASAKDMVAVYPETAAPRAAIPVRLAALALLSSPGVEGEVRVLLVRRGASDRMAGLLDLPAIELAPRARASAALSRLAGSVGWPVDRFEKRGVVRHAITHHRITAEVFVAVVREPVEEAAASALPDEFFRHRIAPRIETGSAEWVDHGAASALELSSLGRKLLLGASGSRGLKDRAKP